MKKRLNIILIAFLLTTFTLIIKSNAAYSSNDPVVTSGDNISITVTSSEKIQNYDIKLLSYAGLTYVGCSKEQEAGAIVEKGSDNLSIGYISTGEGTTTLGTYTFTAPEVSEKTTYTVTFSVNDTTNKSIVTVNPKETTPVTPSEPEQPTTPEKPEKTEEPAEQEEQTPPAPVEPNFTDANITMYANPPRGYNSINLRSTWSTSSSAASIQKGTELQVTATSTNEVNGYVWYRVNYNGQTKYVAKYLLTTTKPEEEKPVEEQEEQPEEPTETEQPTEDPTTETFGLSELIIENIKLSPEFQTDIHEYKAQLTEELDKLTLKTTPTVADATIEVTGNENLVDGENVITVIVKAKVEGKEEEESVAYQITVNKVAKKEETKNNNIVSRVSNKQDKFSKIVIIVVVIGIILIIIFIIMILRIKKTKGLFEDEEENDDNNYNVFKSEQDEFKVNSYKNEDNNDEEITEDTNNKNRAIDKFFNNTQEYEFEQFEEEKTRKRRPKGKRFK